MEKIVGDLFAVAQAWPVADWGESTPAAWLEDKCRQLSNILWQSEEDPALEDFADWPRAEPIIMSCNIIFDEGAQQGAEMKEKLMIAAQSEADVYTCMEQSASRLPSLSAAAASTSTATLTSTTTLTSAASASTAVLRPSPPACIIASSGESGATPIISTSTMMTQSAPASITISSRESGAQPISKTTVKTTFNTTDELTTLLISMTPIAPPPATSTMQTSTTMTAVTAQAASIKVLSTTPLPPAFPERGVDPSALETVLAIEPGDWRGFLAGSCAEHPGSLLAPFARTRVELAGSDGGGRYGGQGEEGSFPWDGGGDGETYAVVFYAVRRVREVE
ncbi:hypothetical protein CBR_g48295 [Chara braunii]|uniref:Uncharacterized protein n=1 Tax=Chara braunii TaxID=69332 RepID=A0A388K460_CHABU|nr:hypothetical protein CBR_g48295 [Chara braunii]|eukprot:GBG64827.1 hypothetical protein CBR_g48295 [Chara braunii]